METYLAPVVAAAAALLAVAAATTTVDRTLVSRLGALPSKVSGGTLRRVAGRLGAARLIRRLPGRAATVQRIANARVAVTEDEVAGAKVLTAGLLALTALSAPWPAALLAPVLAGCGAVLPDVLLVQLARRRVERADREVPLFLDLLAAASLAGLSGQLALRRAVESTEGPLSEELSDVIRSVDLGARWRDELRSASDRLPLPDLRRAVTTMTRAESLGSSLSDALLELASEVRDARRSAATERARKAPVKMLFPLVFLVLPAFLLLTVVPVLISALRSIG
ncbi:MAG TPA: type II secretion system F family protein [Actinomycetota bacterium]|jgi:tight adherence protein C|nr:type II secretion system F family protein [Actinomycetota bacterium]